MMNFLPPGREPASLRALDATPPLPAGIRIRLISAHDAEEAHARARTGGPSGPGFTRAFTSIPDIDCRRATCLGRRARAIAPGATAARSVPAADRHAAGLPSGTGRLHQIAGCHSADRGATDRVPAT